MFNLGPLELMAIFVVALLVFGPDKLPEIGRQVGRAIREFKKIQSGFQNEFRDVLADPPPGPIIPTAPGTPAAPDDPDAPGAPDAPQPATNGEGAPGPPPDTASR